MKKRIMLSVVLSLVMAAAVFAAGAPEIEGEDAPESVTLTGVYDVDATGDKIFTAAGITYVVGLPPFAVDDEILSPGERVTVEGYTDVVTNRLGQELNILHPTQVEIDGTTYVLPAPRLRRAATPEGEIGPPQGRLFGLEQMQRRLDEHMRGRDDGPGFGGPGGRGGRR